MRKHILTQAILLALGGAMLTGCGGGGSDTSSTVVPAESKSITAENAQVTAQSAYDSGVVSNSLLFIASAGTATGQAQHMTLSDVAMNAYGMMKKVEGTSSSGRVTTQALTDEYSYSCTYDGKITFKEVGLDDNPETAQVGDNATITYENCEEVDGFVMNGTQKLTTQKITEMSDARNAVTIEIINDISITTGTDQATLKGTMLLSLDEQWSDTSYSTLIGLRSDKIELTNGTEKEAIYALDYTVFNDSTGAWWFNQDNVLDVNGEVIRIDTTARFDGQNCSYPYQGSGMIYGKNSSVKVTARSGKVTARSGNVTDLEIDTNGDGTVDTTKQVGSGEVFEDHCN